MHAKTKTKISRSLKKHYAKKQGKKELTYLTTITVIISCFFGINNSLSANNTPNNNEYIPNNNNNKPVIIYADYEKSYTNSDLIYPVTTIPTTQNDIKNYITEQAKLHNISPDTALRIAKCESNFNPTAKNPLPGSTASGVYQFINKTFTNYCTGDVFNAKDNIDCFMDIYPSHPDWWECK